MSAWIVSHNHIDTLVYWGIMAGLIDEREADEVGRMLWEENLRSVAYRYPDDLSGDRPGPIGLTDDEIRRYTYRAPSVIPATDYYGEGDPYNPTIALVQLECYDYQSCEHPGFQNSEAHSFYMDLKEELTTNYEAGTEASPRVPWGL